jgi:hypothetical protein
VGASYQHTEKVQQKPQNITERKGFVLVTYMQPPKTTVAVLSNELPKARVSVVSVSQPPKKKVHILTGGGVVHFCRVSGQGLSVNMAEELSEFGELKAASESADVAQIVQIMRENDACTEVQAEGCEAMGCLALKGSETRKRILDDEGVHAVLEALVAHEQDSMVTRKALGALTQLCVDAVISAVVVEETGIPIICNAIQVHNAEADVLERAFKCMRNIVAIDAGAARELEVKLDTMTESMLQHPDFPSLQKNGCRILSSLVRCADLAARMGERAISTLVVIPVLSVLQTHTDDGKVQECACSVFCELGNTNPGLMRSTASSDKSIIQAIVKAMCGHAERKSLQEKCCKLMACLVRHHEGNADQVMVAGGVEALISVIDTHADAVDLHRESLEALRNLAEHTKLLDRLSQQANFTPAILGAVKKYAHNPEVILVGLDAIACMSTTMSNVAALVSEGGIEAVASALQAHPRDARIQEKGVVALYNFAMDQENVVQVIKAGMRGILNAKQTHAENTVLVSACDRALERLKRSSTMKISGPEVVSFACAACKKQIAKAEEIERMVSCNKCTLAPKYCTVQCRRVARDAHKQECNTNAKREDCQASPRPKKEDFVDKLFMAKKDKNVNLLIEMLRQNVREWGTVSLICDAFAEIALQVVGSEVEIPKGLEHKIRKYSENFFLMPTCMAPGKLSCMLGAIELLVKAMGLHKGHVKVQLACCQVCVCVFV